VLIVPTGGGRAMRVGLPPWLGAVALGVLAVSAWALTAFLTDYLLLRRQWSEIPRTEARLAEQRGRLEAFERGSADLAREVATRGAVHARIWEPLGPEAGGGRRGAGIGGGALPARGALEQPGGGHGLERLAGLVAAEGERLRTLERFMARAGGMLAALPSRWPIRGTVNSEFGRRASPWTGAPEFHGGMDIGAAPGTPVRAPAPGVVAAAGLGGEYGYHVILDHGNGIRSLYGHLQRIAVRPGQAVERGQVLALSGNTGRSSGPHLHYEILVRGQPVNPRAFLWDP
jgi:murein DD-endopeptidase MepM/ murein hydrolase activator NlpD